MYPFFLYLKKAQKKFRMMDSFFLFLKTKAIQNDGFLFPFSEESTNGIQNDGFLFPLFEESIKGIANHAILIPFSLSRRKHTKEFGMMNPYFLFLHKNKTGNWIFLHPQSRLALPTHKRGLGMRLPSRSIQLHLISDL